MRGKKECPECQRKVINLPRHFRTAHKWKPEKARAAVQIFGLRKPYACKQAANEPTSKNMQGFGQTGVQKRYIDYHKLRPCPIPGCYSVVKRMSAHLRGVHHFQAESNVLQIYLKEAREAQKQSIFDVDYEQSMGEDEFDDVEGNAEQHGVPIRPKSWAQQLENYQKWLISTDGGRKNEKSAKQHGSQLSVIMESVDSLTHDISKLLDKNLVKDNFLDMYVPQKGFRPGTVTSYLSSLRHWCDFQMLHSPEELSQAEKQKIDRLKQCCIRWIASYKKESMKRGLEKMDSDLHKLVTSDDLVTFSKSELATTAVKLLGVLSRGPPIKIFTQHQYIHVRDFLMAQIIFSNANRSGVISNMTVKQVKQAKVVDGHYVVSVIGHKTSEVYGPAKIVLKQAVHRWLVIFIDKLLPQLIRPPRKSSCELVFLSWNCEQLSSGQISRCLQSLWKKAGLRTDITCTLFRKAAVSAMHSQHPQMKADLADLMCHRQETANKYYRLVQREQTSVAAAKKLSEVMNISKEGQLHVECDTVNNRVDSMLNSNTSEVVTPSIVNNRRLFSADDVAVLLRCCSAIIESGPISNFRIEDALGNSDDGKLLLSNFNMSQLVSRIKYQRTLGISSGTQEKI